MTRSKLPKAIRFTDWVFDDLLPKIRKFGKPNPGWMTGIGLSPNGVNTS